MATPESKKSSKLIKILLLVILIIGISIASTFFLLKQFGASLVGDVQPALAAEQQEPVVPKPIFLPLDAFTVTLNEPRSNRILYAEISLRVLNDASRQQLQTYMPEVRSRVLAELARYDAASLQSTEGRSQLTHNLLAALKLPYDTQLTAPAISSVLFTAFVVQ